MCGIAGYFNTKSSEPAREHLLDRMIERIRYRGPDDKGVWTDGPVGFSHCRLSILDLSPRGHQPFVTADGQGAITYNGEVYNFKELRAELEREGVRFTSATDTEVVLYALHRWGPLKAVPRFNGMFAFGYYDKRDGFLWLARDRTGIKPLYMTDYGKGIAFASESKALLAHPEVACKPDVHALASFIVYQRFEGEWTPFEGIEDVKAGTIVKVSRCGVERTTYFDVLRDVDVDRLLEFSRRPAGDMIAEFEQSLADSVRIHLVSDAPLATMCSGGIDSALTTVVAKQFKPDVVAYVANVEGAIPSEGEKAEKVGRHAGIQVRRINVNREELLRLWPTAIWHGDQPNCHANDMPYIMVVRACHADGIKVVVTGEGSDELFGGYPWQVKAYQMWRRRRLHSRFIPNIPAFRLAGKLHPKLEPIDVGPLKRDPFYRMEQIPDDQEFIRFASVSDGGRRLFRHEALFKKLEKIEPIEDRAFLARAFEDWYGNLQAILHRNDRISMSASVEARVPFLENEMMALGMHFPRWMKYNEGKTKWVVKKAAERGNKLPPEITHARKIHFAVPLRTFLAASGLLKSGMASELLKWGRQETEAIVARADRMPTVMHNLLGVEIWARIFLKGELPDQLGEKLHSLSRTGNGSRPAQVA